MYAGNVGRTITGDGLLTYGNSNYATAGCFLGPIWATEPPGTAEIRIPSGLKALVTGCPPISAIITRGTVF
jgi:hypothetical protein